MLSQHALLVVSQHALQQISGGWCYPSIPCSGRNLLLGVPSLGRGCLLLGGAWSVGGCVAFWFGGLLIEGGLVESGLLLRPSS